MKTRNAAKRKSEEITNNEADSLEPSTKSALKKLKLDLAFESFGKEKTSGGNLKESKSSESSASVPMKKLVSPEFKLDKNRESLNKESLGKEKIPGQNSEETCCSEASTSAIVKKSTLNSNLNLSKNKDYIDKENTYGDVKIKPYKKIARSTKDWKLVGIFSPDEYIFQQLNEYMGWQKYYKSGKNFYYKCCQANKGCRAELRISLIKDDPEDFLNYEIKIESSGEHSDCVDNNNLKKFIDKRKKWGIPPLLKHIIKRKEYFFIKPKKAVIKLREIKKIEEDKLEINYDKIKRYCHHQKTKYYRKNLKNTIAQLNKLLNSYSYHSNIKDDKLFVLYKNLDLSKLQVLFSSKSLLKNVVNQSQFIKTQSFEGNVPSFFHVDGTYELIDAGFVTLVLGTENIYHQFRQIAFSIVAHEDKHSFEMFGETQNWIATIFNYKWTPSYALMDGAKSAFNATKEIFGSEIKVILCWFHLLKAIRSHISTGKSESSKNICKNIGHLSAMVWAC